MIVRRAAISLLLCLAAARAADLEIHYTAIQKMLAQEVFTQDGRRYVRGSPATKCSFAYLEHPELRGDNGRLSLKARFTGRSALDVFGRCIGLGDSFDVFVTAVPYYHSQSIGLKDVRVEGRAPEGAPRSGYYVRRVCAALGDSLRKQFDYRVGDQARRILEQTAPAAAYRQELLDFSVPRIQVMPDALIVTVDFRLAVK
ncbi:MAG: hypothetical protein ABSF54_22870 [Bryobacteraceae bacterium]|jgi:hypothetical protein